MFFKKKGFYKIKGSSLGLAEKDSISKEKGVIIKVIKKGL
jgi:hypothetical protein